MPLLVWFDAHRTEGGELSLQAVGGFVVGPFAEAGAAFGVVLFEEKVGLAELLAFGLLKVSKEAENLNVEFCLGVGFSVQLGKASLGSFQSVGGLLCVHAHCIRDEVEYVALFLP